MQEIILAAEQLYCERDERILFENLSFNVPVGAALRVEGVNGSGKTTLLRILAGLNQAWEGKLEWRGQAWKRQRELAAAETIFVGHATGIKPGLTAEENLAWLTGLRCDTDREVIWAALARVGLAGSEDLHCAALSAGQQRRVALARLFLAPASLWVLDEPFTSLDRGGIEDLEAAMAEHLTTGGALIFSSHQDPASLVSYDVVRLGETRRVEQV